jgi:hypothetical protein
MLVMPDAAHLAYMLHGGLLVEFLSLALNDVQGVFRAMPDAGSKPVTKHVSDNSGLAVDDGQSALGASRHALAAARALFFVYLDDFSFHAFLRCLLRESSLWALRYGRFEPCQKKGDIRRKIGSAPDCLAHTVEWLPSSLQEHDWAAQKIRRIGGKRWIVD